MFKFWHSITTTTQTTWKLQQYLWLSPKTAELKNGAFEESVNQESGSDWAECPLSNILGDSLVK